MTLAYDYDERTTIEAGIHGSLIVDRRMDRWFSAINLDPDVLWATIGATWTF